MGSGCSLAGFTCGELVLNSTLLATMAILVISAIVVYLMPLFLLCTGNDNRWARAVRDVADEPARIGVITKTMILVLIASVYRSFYDDWTVDHNFSGIEWEVVGLLTTLILVAICAAILVKARKWTYGLLILCALLLLTFYLSDPTARNIMLGVAILVAGFVMYATHHIVELVIIDIAASIVASESIIYGMLYFLSDNKDRINDATADIKAASDCVHRERCLEHFIISIVLIMFQLVLLLSNCLVSNCRRRVTIDPKTGEPHSTVVVYSRDASVHTASDLEDERDVEKGNKKKKKVRRSKSVGSTAESTDSPLGSTAEEDRGTVELIASSKQLIQDLEDLSD